MCPDYPPLVRGGGAETFKLLTETWRECGHNVTVLSTLQKNKNLNNLPKKDNLGDPILFHLFSLPKIFKEATFFAPLIFAEHHKLLKWIKRNYYKFDYIVINGITETISREVLFHLPATMKDRIILINHGLPTAKYDKFLSFISIIVHKSIGKILVMKSNKIVVFSDSSAYEYNGFYGLGVEQKLYQFPLGIDFRQFKQIYRFLSHDETNIRYWTHKLGIKSKFIFSIGRNVRTKGFDQLVKSFSEILPEFPDLELVIGGDSTEYTNELKWLTEKLKISDKVKFLGRVEESAKIALFLNCDLFVIPSLKEGFGLNAIEARVLNIKTIATLTGSHGKILDEKRCNKLIIDPEAELTNAIREMLNKQECIQKWNEGIEQKFDIKKTGKELINVMLDSVEESIKML